MGDFCFFFSSDISNMTSLKLFFRFLSVILKVKSTYMSKAITYTKTYGPLKLVKALMRK